MLNTLKSTFAIGAIALGLSVSAPSSAQAQDYYIGQIIIGGWNFCPRGTFRLDGSLLSINENQALFSLLGTNYGGDGRTTFGLPDMRGRVPVHTGQGPGLSDRRLGQTGGSEANTLSVAQLPAHSHALSGTATAANTPSPAGALPATTGRDSTYAAGTPDTAMAAGAIGSTGAGSAVNNMPPFNVVTYCMVGFGIYPSRN
ncbi:tail fiber protein [Dinoroseobacter sp. PD6]|uniref:phage tail protein n=1 Tax=Dinoroseobacter sp. PD6 TaxID=3028384 RepID=UPI00237A8941|nr:tail fiber protein [Dinoroseobacter sp. PD6]MDD9716425.1 tail fiber protein [Dinoroseobacter sp. PD6]